MTTLYSACLLALLATLAEAYPATRPAGEVVFHKDIVGGAIDVVRYEVPVPPLPQERLEAATRRGIRPGVPDRMYRYDFLVRENASGKTRELWSKTAGYYALTNRFSPPLRVLDVAVWRESLVAVYQANPRTTCAIFVTVDESGNRVEIPSTSQVLVWHQEDISGVLPRAAITHVPSTQSDVGLFLLNFNGKVFTFSLMKEQDRSWWDFHGPDTSPRFFRADGGPSAANTWRGEHNWRRLFYKRVTMSGLQWELVATVRPFEQQQKDRTGARKISGSILELHRSPFQDKAGPPNPNPNPRKVLWSTFLPIPSGSQYDRWGADVCLDGEAGMLYLAETDGSSFRVWAIDWKNRAPAIPESVDLTQGGHPVAPADPAQGGLLLTPDPRLLAWIKRIDHITISKAGNDLRVDMLAGRKKAFAYSLADKVWRELD